MSWLPSCVEQTIAFNGGQGYECEPTRVLPSTGGGCDSAHKQIPPVSASAQVRRHPVRDAACVAARESISTASSAPSKARRSVRTGSRGAPATLAGAQVVDSRRTGPFVVTARSEPSVLPRQIMPGCKRQGGRPPPGGCLGGRGSTVNLVPPKQF